VQGEKDLSEAFDRFQAHLDSNRIDLRKTPAVLGAALRMVPSEERFAGPLSEPANRLLRGDYRAPFVVPESV
jgi:hypothetical protein